MLYTFRVQSKGIILYEDYEDILRHLIFMSTVSVHAVLFANNDEYIVKVPQCIKLLLHVQMRRYHNGPKKLQL